MTAPDLYPELNAQLDVVDHPHLWSPLEDLPDGAVAYGCIVDDCDRELVEEPDGTYVEVQR